MPYREISPRLDLFVAEINTPSKQAMDGGHTKRSHQPRLNDPFLELQLPKLSIISWLFVFSISPVFLPPNGISCKPAS